MFSSVIFDLDGVLIDSMGVMQIAYSNACSHVGVLNPPPFSDFLQHMGKDLKTIIRTLGLPDAVFDVYVAQSIRRIDEIKLFPNIRTILSRLRDEGITMAIATGKEGVRARSILSRLELLDYFDCVLGGDEVKMAKPDPESILTLLETLQSDPDETLFVGDAVADMIAGKKAQVKVAAALWGVESYEALAVWAPDYYLHKPMDLLSVLPHGVSLWQ